MAREIPILPEHPEPPPPPVVEAPPEPPLPSRPPPRQTLSYLRNLLQGFGLQPKSKLGQNFLIDLNLLDLTCRAAELLPNDSVLEVGTGTGSLTALMAQQAGCVYTVEVDDQIQAVARQLVGDRSNVYFHSGDALASKNTLNPYMLEGWKAWTAKHGCTRLKLVANLPYVIATPLISNLLISEVPVERMVVMVQWEIAERMQAVPGTKDFNALSVLVQSLADVSTVRKVLPTNFFPQPKVNSAIVLIKPNAEKRAKVGDVQAFRNFLRDLYTHRRKNLRQALIGWPTGAMDKATVDAKLAALGFDGTGRSEVLDLDQHLRLSRAFTS
jgi:16S rRNA (adenine1518-N6/adenine1519-N6)-dimethyltransferase